MNLDSSPISISLTNFSRMSNLNSRPISSSNGPVPSVLVSSITESDSLSLSGSEPSGLSLIVRKWNTAYGKTMEPYMIMNSIN